MQLHGKQIKDASITLSKLGDTGVVTFTSSTMSFDVGSTLRRATIDIVNGTDVVNKEYVDAIASGLDAKESVRVISLTDITLSGLQTIDGVALVAGDRVLVNGQSDETENGIYDVDTGAWARSADSDGNPTSEVTLGNFTFVEEGTDNTSSGWVLSISNTPNRPIVDPDTDTQKWVQFSDAGGYSAGTGLDLSGSVFSIDDTGVIAGNYGDGATVPTFTVNAQGQLTTATDVAIAILSNQVSDFSTSVLTEIFNTTNFVDSTTIDFTVTSGTSVTADVVADSIGANELNVTGNGNAGDILESDGAGGFTWVENQLGDITDVNAGVGLTGGGTAGSVTLDVEVNNGINIGPNNQVELGGTLDKNTNIDGDGFDFTIGNAGIIHLTSSTFDVESDFFSIDAGTGSGQIMADDTIIISASNSIDLTSTGSVNVTGSSFNVNSVEIDPTSPTTGYVLSYDGTKFAPAPIGGGTITEVVAGDGLTGGGSGGSITLDVEVNNGLNIGTTGEVELGGTLDKDTNINGTGVNFGLTAFNVGIDAGFDVRIGASNSVYMEADSQIVLTAPTGDIILNAGQVEVGNSSTTYVSVKGIEFDPTGASTNDVLTYVGNKFVPMPANSGDITGVTAGDGLIGGGTAGDVTISIDPTLAGNGLTYSAGVLSIDDSVKPVPYYGDMNLTPTLVVANLDNQDTGIEIANTPDKYSRVEVTVNGQVQVVGNGVTTTACYFGDTPGTAKTIENIVATDKLFWNSLIAGYTLDNTDEVGILYEVKL